MAVEQNLDNQTPEENENAQAEVAEDQVLGTFRLKAEKAF